jgi:hypothetical protein
MLGAIGEIENEIEFQFQLGYSTPERAAVSRRFKMGETSG